jgi:hypothetical protein
MLVSRLSFVLILAAPALLMAGGAQTTTVLNSVPNPSLVGQSVTLTATVNSPTVTGSIEFWDGGVDTGTDLGPATSFSSGVGTLTITTLALGPHSLTAVFNSDTNGFAWNNSTSAPLTQNVLNATTTVLTSSASPVNYGQTVTLTATLNPLSATGKVTFYDGVTVLGTGTAASGIATLTTLLASGVRHLKAYYEGDSSDAAASSAPFSQTITAIAGNGFQPPNGSLGTGLAPFGMATGDFNGDGIADFVVTDQTPGNVIVILSGGGTYSGTYYSVGASPVSVAVGDFDGDGNLDIAVANQDDGTVSVLLGNNMGVFAPATDSPYTVGANPSFVAVGDFNGDGIPDLVVTNPGSSNLDVLLGVGDGTFDAPVIYTAGTNPSSVAVADVNQDGFADLVVTNQSSGNVSVLLGAGDGTFGAAANYPTGSVPVFVVAADFNGDGYPDLAVVNGLGSSLSVLLNDGTGLFTGAVSYPVGAFPIAAGIGDFNGDGHPDLAVTSSTAVSVLLGNSDGTFNTAVGYGSDSVTGIVVADVNGDGIADILAADITSNNSLELFFGLVATSTTLTSSENPAAFGDSITFTATLAPLAATGTVTFEDNGSPIGSEPVTLVDGVATLPVSNLALGSHPITVVYSGDSTYGVSTSSTVNENVLTAVTTTLTSSENPSTYNDTVTFTATLSNTLATGTVTFNDSGSPIGSGPVTVTGGVATLAISSLLVGAHPITAVYSGDSTYAGNTSSTLSQVVLHATTTTVLSSLNPSTFGAGVTFTASIQAGVSGTVVFNDNGSSIGSGSVNLINGMATLSLSSLSVGSHPITAVYSGDSSYAGSTSTVLTQVVDQVTTTTLLTSSRNPAAAGEFIALTAAVTPAQATGTVAFKAAGSTVGTANVINGQATYAFSSITIGPVALTAVYSGDTNDATSTSSPLSETIATATPVTLISAGSPSQFGQTVLLTAGVTPTSATGKVSFYDGTTALGTATLSSGSAAFTAILASGVRSLTAYYEGDGSNAPGTSTAVTQTVNATAGNGFQSPVTYATGNSDPWNMAAGDFNGDGHMDLAVTDIGSSVLAVFLGNSDGTFQAAVPYSVGTTPTGVAVADLNGDGLPDLIVTNYTSNNIGVLLGVGAGAFAAQVTYGIGPDGSNPSLVAVGDFNRDGIPDLAVTNRSTGIVVVLMGIGDGTFQAPVPYAVGTAPASVAVGDFNHDGYADLAVVNQTSGNVSVLLGNADGTFQTAVNYEVGASPTVVVVADFNNDGSPDLAVANGGDGTVSLLLGTGSGTFNTQAIYPVSSDPIDLAVGDFNGDGYPDLAASNNGNGSVSILLALSNGTFAPAVTTVNSSHAAGIVVGDFNGDGITDYAVTNADGGSQVQVFLGTPTTSTTLISSLNPSNFGDSVTFTATLAPLSATGTVTFYDGVTVLGSGPVTLTSGIATLPISSLALGTHAITAAYSGDSNNSPSISSALTQTVLTATTTTLTSSENPSISGDTVTFTATLAPLAATGTVTFKHGVTTLGSVTLVNGVAILAVNSLTLGEHSITAVYNGDSNYGVSTSSALNENVVTATTTTLISSLNPSSFGNSVTLTATLAPLAATGTVTFKDGSTTLGSGPVNLTSGVATLSLSSLAVGSHSLTAVYSGDSNYAVSTSLVVTQNVVTATTTTLISSLNPSTYGTSVTFTATLAPLAATGTVTFKDGSTTLGSGAVTLVSGVAVLSLNTLTFAAHSITAVYSGDANYGVSTSSTTIQTVNEASPTMLLTSSANPLVFGHSVMLTATLSNSLATGKTTFYQGSTVLGTSVVSSGVAVFTTPLLAFGTQALKAYYEGDANDEAATSAALPQAVNSVATTGFDPMTTYAAGAIPYTAAVGDFNGDGFADLVVTNENANTVTVLLGNGNGTFQAGATYTVSNTVLGVAVGDFNGDGKPDLAVTNDDGVVSVLLGDGTGTFGSAVNYTVGPDPQFVAVGDFNGDGFADVVVTNLNNTLSVLIGKGDGTFNTAVAYTAGTAPYGIAVGDFNADGYPDLAVANLESNTVSVLLGRGDGTFHVAVNYATGTFPGLVAVGDFNGDGKPDLAVTNLQGNTVSVLLGVGDGTFQTQVPYDTGIRPVFIAVGDFNGDGNADLAVGNQNSGTLSVLNGAGDGTFQAAVNYSTGSSPQGIAVADFNRDGRSDVAVANSGDGTMGILLGFSVSPTTTTLTSSLNLSTFGVSVTLTATLAPLSATGTVTFMDGSTVLGPGTLTSGVAMLALSNLSIGAHSLTAVYGGDTYDQASTSAALTQTVNTIPTVTTLTSSANPMVYGQAVDLTATVSPSTATGTVIFKDGSAILFTVPLTNGVATLAVQTLSSGAHALTAVYSGDALDAVSTGSLSLEVDSCGTTVETSLFVDSVGGPQTVTVASTAPSCAWNASTASPWIELSDSGGVGSGALTATLSQNTTGAVRTGTILVGAQSIAVTQRITAQVFADVPPSIYYFDPVNTLYAKQITAGCTSDPLNYCPDMNIPRWEMAVFIARAVFGGDNFTAPTLPIFNDVPQGSPGFAWIQEMSQLGITSGCGNGDFCPDQTVSREQMAVFVIRMRYGATAIFDFPATPYFTDVTSESFGWSWIQRMKEDAVTSGCSTTLFCPTDPVTRGEMGVFVMAGGFNFLLPAGTPVISAISPGTITHGTTATFTVTGLNTNFVQGTTEIAPIPGITIGAVTVTTPTSLTVQLTAASDAIQQPVSVLAITGIPPGNEEAVLPNSLVIQ